MVPATDMSKDSELFSSSTDLLGSDSVGGILTKQQEQERANDTLLRGTCFISKVSLSNKPYELVWHAGANSYVFVDKIFLTTEEKEKTDDKTLSEEPSP